MKCCVCKRELLKSAYSRQVCDACDREEREMLRKFLKKLSKIDSPKAKKECKLWSIK